MCILSVWSSFRNADGLATAVTTLWHCLIVSSLLWPPKTLKLDIQQWCTHHKVSNFIVKYFSLLTGEILDGTSKTDSSITGGALKYKMLEYF